MLRTDDGQPGNWPSRAALAADLAAERVLRSRADGWSAVDPATRGEVLSGLRMFLETCPTAGGGVRTGVEAVESCCSSQSVYAVTCEETGDRLFEYPVGGA